ncbi:MAG: diacylglycerol kinase family protein [Bacteroidia bacterium]
MQSSNIALLVNAKAGKGKAMQLSLFLQSELKQKNIAHKVFIDDWTDELTTFTEAWVVGGDGTLNFFLNKYPECNIPIAIYKGGTGNDIAWKLYGDITDKEQLEYVLNATPKNVDAGMCNDKVFINGIGIGFDGEVLKSIKAIRLMGGHIGYLLVVIKKIFSFKEFHFTISIDERKITGKFLLLLVFNSSRTGGGFHVAPTALMNDGLLNVVLCKPLSVLQRLRYLPVIEKGKHLHLPFIDHSLGKEIVIECNTILPAQCDGELIHAKRFVIKVLPGKFLFKY